VKFLIDECISVRTTELLVAAGHDAIHATHRGLLGKSDDDVLATALDEGRVLISADTDFGELLARAGLALPSVILLRQGNRTPEHRAATLLANLDSVVEDLAAGSIVGLTDDRIRVRRLPLP
jgi:predicted nuclease of predicted toxin-antitoxin system